MKLNYVHVAQAIQELGDSELRMLISLLSSDYTNTKASTMRAMCYIYKTPQGAIPNVNIRESVKAANS